MFKVFQDEIFPKRYFCIKNLETNQIVRSGITAITDAQEQVHELNVKAKSDVNESMKDPKRVVGNDSGKVGFWCACGHYLGEIGVQTAQFFLSNELAYLNPTPNDCCKYDCSC
jgi:hypothetical protein